MIDSCFRPEISHEPNYSVQYALYLVLRRHPWATVVARTRDIIRRFFLLALAAVSLTVLSLVLFSLDAVLPAPMQAHIDDVLTDEAANLVIAVLGGSGSLEL